MRIRPVVIAPLIGALLVLSAGAAGAVGQVAVSDAAPSPGTSIAVTSTGWFPGRAVTVGLTGTDGILGRAIADAGGSVHTRVTVPRDTALDTNVLSVTGTASSGVPQQIVTALAVHSTAPAPTPSRPWLFILVLALIAGLLVLASVRVATPARLLAG
jgi:hypothetical protein